jgi:hypothetical protein
VTEQEWQTLYRITSVQGKIWTRRAVRTRASRILLQLVTDQTPLAIRTAVQLVLDDPKFMRFRVGEVPSRVSEDVAFEALFRLRGIRHQEEDKS